MKQLQQALDDGQEIHIFKLMGEANGYCVEIYGDCHVEARSRETLTEAIEDAARLYAGRQTEPQPEQEEMTL